MRQPEATGQSVTKLVAQPHINITKCDTGALTAGAEYEGALRANRLNFPEALSQAARAENHAWHLHRERKEGQLGVVSENGTQARSAGFSPRK